MWNVTVYVRDVDKKEGHVNCMYRRACTALKQGEPFFFHLDNIDGPKQAGSMCTKL